MIVDASALVAIVRGEDGWQGLVERITSVESPRISAATWVEAAIVVDAAGDPEVSRRYDRLLAELGLEIVPLDSRQAEIARSAYRDYGKGSGHPARLNLGDVFSYALASTTGEPLLFTGDDFARTDLRPALPSA